MLHLLKLCVGAESIADLEHWIAQRRCNAEALGQSYEQSHTTRMVPKKADDLLAGGSLYWVIKGRVACRQRLMAIRPFTDEAGIGRCDLVMEPVVVPVAGGPCRPFQGWRYLAAKDAPQDLGAGLAEGAAAMPEEMRRELATLGLL